MTAPGIFAAVNRMYDANTVEEAQAAARDFANAGASPADVADLLAEWDRKQSVTVLTTGGAR